MDKPILCLSICFILLKSVYAQNNSIAFAIDTTASMTDEFEAVKGMAIEIFEEITNNPQYSIDKLILVPFNDPGFGPALTTKDPKTFKASIQSLYVYNGGGDCVEMCFSGISLALNESVPNSYLYVFTDAPPKDEYLLDTIVTQIRVKKMQILIILTDGCYQPKDLIRFEAVTQPSFGQIFEIAKTSIHLVKEYIQSTLTLENQVNVGVFIHEPGFGNIFNISVDFTMMTFSISVAGASPEIVIRNPKNEIVSDIKQLNVTINLPKIKIINLINPEPGMWTASIGSATKHSIKIVATSDIRFDYTFFKNKLSDIVDIPTKGEATYILIKIIDDEHKIDSLHSIEIVEISGKVLFEIPVGIVSESSSKNVYKTLEHFSAPDFLFSISIKGVDVHGNPFKRASSSTIVAKAETTSIIDQSIFFEKPVIHNFQEVQTFEHNQTAVLHCNVTGIPEPTITWILPNNEKVETSCNKYIIDKIASENEGNYTCVASNSAGREERRTKVDLKNGSTNLCPQMYIYTLYIILSIICLI